MKTVISFCLVLVSCIPALEAWGEVETVNALDVNKYAGRWFEVKKIVHMLHYNIYVSADNSSIYWLPI